MWRESTLLRVQAAAAKETKDVFAVQINSLFKGSVPLGAGPGSHKFFDLIGS